MSMSSSSSASATFPCHLPHTFSSVFRKQKLFSSVSFRKTATAPFICLKIGLEELAELAYNKALIAAAVSSAVGQFSKPFTSALYGNGVDFKAAFRSGGMPSTHSAGVVAATTSLGLQRGFSDSIFGMSVVFAAIVMYDAQGVRKEVGYHAKILNKMVLKAQESVPSIPYREEDYSIESKRGTSSLTSETPAPVLSLSEKGSSYGPNPMPPSIPRSDNVTRTSPTSSKVVDGEDVLRKATSISNPMPPSIPRSDNVTRTSPTSSKVVDGEDVLRKATSISAVESEEMVRKAYGSYVPLKEYVGHTEVEVLFGALLGFIVSLAVDTLI